MKVFDHPNADNGWKCPVCGKADDKPVALVAIHGAQDGNMVQAEQFHLDCLELWYHQSMNTIIQTWEKSHESD
jgi:hypothetical protein